MGGKLLWLISGADSSGGAGMQADLHTAHDFGVHACSIITALTAQNSQGISHIEYTSPTSLAAQLSTLATDMPAAVIKLGMLGNRDLLQCLSEFLAQSSATIICDPVISASSCGTYLLADADLSFFKQHILPHVDILTPNLPEAERLLDCQLNSSKLIEQAAQQLLSLGVKQVIIKGGHHDASRFSQDYFTDGVQSCWLTSPRQAQRHTHGTGCSFASALASAFTLGYVPMDAFVIAKMYVNQGIRLAAPLGQGIGPIKHLGWPEQAEDLPWLTTDALSAQHDDAFPPCNEPRLGLYPVVPNADWVQRLAELGVNTIQLRIKNTDEITLQQEIRQAVVIAQHYKLRLFINDYWQEAIAQGAYGVHLGQEDLAIADINAIRHAGLRLGISTHTYAELARAYAYRPSYIAFGAIFPTTSKTLATQPQGLTLLRRWRSMVAGPLVAIGGINLSNCAQVLVCNVDGVAMISAITASQDPASTVRQLQTIIHS